MVASYCNGLTTANRFDMTDCVMFYILAAILESSNEPLDKL